MVSAPIDALRGLPADVAAAFADRPLAAHGFRHKPAAEQAALLEHLAAASRDGARGRRLERLLAAIEAEETGC